MKLNGSVPWEQIVYLTLACTRAEPKADHRGQPSSKGVAAEVCHHFGNAPQLETASGTDAPWKTYRTISVKPGLLSLGDQQQEMSMLWSSAA